MTTLKTEKLECVPTNGAKTGESVSATAHNAGHPLDRVFGIFQDEPLMDALMERVRADRRAEREADIAE